MATLMNVNQFEQSAIKGTLDLHTAGSGVITGVVSSAQTGSVYPGDRVALDNAAGEYVPSFLTVATGVAAIGVVIFSSKKSASTYAAGDTIEVALVTGPAAIMYCEVATAAIAAQAYVCWNTGQTVITNGGQKQMGIALDAGAVGSLIRVILTMVTL